LWLPDPIRAAALLSTRLTGRATALSPGVPRLAPRIRRSSIVLPRRHSLTLSFHCASVSFFASRGAFAPSTTCASEGASTICGSAASTEGLAGWHTAVSSCWARSIQRVW
jgi:hypothetical protein